MSGKIIALVCPQCSNASHEGLCDRAYGGEFKCSACGVTSVLVVNNQLYVTRVGEQVCKICGRVAARGARYCQCSSLLIKKCNDCGREFSVDNVLCPQCCWDVAITLNSEAGIKRKFSLIEPLILNDNVFERNRGWKVLDDFIIKLFLANSFNETESSTILNHLVEILNQISTKIHYWPNAFQSGEPNNVFQKLIKKTSEINRGRLIEVLENIIRSDKTGQATLDSISLLADLGDASLLVLERLLLDPPRSLQWDSLGWESLRWSLHQVFTKFGHAGAAVVIRNTGLFSSKRLREFGKPWRRAK